MIDVAAAMSKVAQTFGPEETTQAVVNFLDPHELARKVFEDSRESDPQREVYLQQAAQDHRYDQAEKRYNDTLADRKRRQEARKAEQRLKTEKARADKAKRKKMKKRGR